MKVYENTQSGLPISFAIIFSLISAQLQKGLYSLVLSIEVSSLLRLRPKYISKGLMLILECGYIRIMKRECSDAFSGG